MEYEARTQRYTSILEYLQDLEIVYGNIYLLRFCVTWFTARNFYIQPIFLINLSYPSIARDRIGL